MFSASGLKNETLKVKLYIYDCKLQLMGDSCRRTTVSLIYFFLLLISYVVCVLVFQGSTYLLSNIFWPNTPFLFCFQVLSNVFAFFCFVFVVIYFDILTDRLSTSTCEKF